MGEAGRCDRVMLLTPPGAGAIAVVRLAGPGVAAFLGRHFSRPAREGRCVHGELRDERGRVIDDAVVVPSGGGAAADVNVHGGTWVVSEVIELARRAGFEVVADDPAMHDAGSEVEREVLAAVPLARTELALRALLGQVRAWEELERAADREERLRRMLDDRALHWLLHPPRVAIVGAANVGKSTLANRLFAQERSITADVPGTTRDWVGEVANLDGLAVMLVDTPGLRDTGDPIEREAIEASRGVVGGADLVVVVLDATRELEGEQAAVLAAHPSAVVVVNKSDRPCAWAPPAGAIRTVATTGEGVDALRSAIRARFGCDGLDVAAPRLWTARQRNVAERMLATGNRRPATAT